MFMELWSLDPSLLCNMLAFVALKAAVKTHSRRQSGLVCSLLVVSLLLSAAVGGGDGELINFEVAVVAYSSLAVQLSVQ